MLSRLLAAHEGILIQAHEMAARAAELGDDRTDGQLVFQVTLTGGLQARFLAEQCRRHAAGAGVR